MTQTNLQEFARSKGIKKNIQKMTQAEQVQLRYNYVMAKTKDAQGDFARTGDQAANAGRKFHEALGELSAKIGTNLLPMFTPLINMANNLIEKLSKMSPLAQKIILIIGGLGAIIGPLLIGLGTFIKLINSSITALIKFPGNVKKGVGSLKKFAGSLKNATKSVLKFTKSILKIGWKGVTKGASLSVKAIKGFGKATLNAIKVIAKLTLQFAKLIIKLTISAVKWTINTARLLAHKAAQLAVTAATKAMTLAQKALNLAMSMNPIALVITLLLSLVVVFVTLYNKCAWFRDGVNAVWNKIKSVFSGFVNFLKGAFTTDWTGSFGAFGNIINAFMHNVSSVWNAIKRIFSGVIDFIKGVFTGNWSEAWQGVVNIFGGIMNGLGAVLKAPLNAVIGMINAAISGINSISVDIPSWVPVVGGQHFGVNLPQMNYLWKGGIFTQPTMLNANTVVGDKYNGQGSNPEAVIPLDKLWSKLDKIANRPINLIIEGRELAYTVAENQDVIDSYFKGRNV